MANSKRNGEDGPPAPLILIAMLLVGALLINTKDQLAQDSGAVLVLSVIVWMVADLLAMINPGED